METISNVTNAASKLIWGEGNTTSGNETGGQEPVSGEQGKGTANDPFDKGNSEDPTTTSDNRQTPSSASTNPTSSSNMTDAAPHNPVNAAAGGDVNPDVTTDKTGVTAGLPGDPPKGRDVVPSESAANPGAAPSSGGELQQKQHGGDRPLEEPTSSKEEGAVKETKDDAEEILKKRDPNDHSGEPMHMHGAPEGGSSGVPATQEERRESKVGMPGGQEHGKEPKGTGEEWIRTSGMASEGGDFDATKPGAGREADRLMEEKGIKRADAGAKDEGPVSTNPDAGEQKEKVPLSEKIKTKLHIGHKDK